MQRQPTEPAVIPGEGAPQPPTSPSAEVGPQPPAPPLPPVPTLEAEPDVTTRRGKVESLGRHAWALVGVGLALAGVLYLLSKLAWLVVPVLLTAIFAVVASAPVGALERRGMRRSIATSIVYLVLVAVLGGVIWLGGSIFVRQVGELALDVPQLASDLGGQLEDFQNRLEDASPAAANAVGQFKDSVVQRSESFGADLADSVFGLVGTTLGFLTASLLALILSFMITKDLPKLTAAARRWLERPENLRIRGAAGAMSRSVTGFVRGQLVVAIIVGLLKTVVFWLLGLPYYVPLGVLSGIGQLVPAVGPFVVGIPPVLIALAQGGVAWALLTLAALVVVQLASTWWLSPRFIGTDLQLPTLVVILALIVGAMAFGLWGLVAAVPVAAAVRDGVHWALLPSERLDEEIAVIDERKTLQRRRRREAKRRARRAEATSSAEGD